MTHPRSAFGAPPAGGAVHPEVSKGAGLRRGGRHAAWALAKRLLTLAFFAVVAWLLIKHARTIEWSEVGDAISAYPAGTLLAAAALAALSHGIYSTYDLLGRHWTGHGVPARTVQAVTFVSYAFNLNFGSLVGGFAFRYRLYSRLGLDNPTITRVLGLSLTTNWLGYLLLAGGVFALRIITPPEGWDIGAGALQALGFALVGAALAYIALCAFSKRREWSIRGHDIVLPPTRLALLQLALSCANWMVIAATIHTLLQGRAGYALVLGVLLIAAIAGVITHIPAGLGVLEAVFVTFLVPPLAQGGVIAALLAYRALYYLAPLALAAVVYLLLEARAKRQPAGPRTGTAIAGSGHPTPDGPRR